LRFGAFGLWANGRVLTGFLVCFLTIEYEKKEKRGRRSSRIGQRCLIFERDFGGHVYQEKLHWFLALRLSGFDVWKTGVKFSSIQRT
jgi:hypothetical protein